MSRSFRDMEMRRWKTVDIVSLPGADPIFWKCYWPAAGIGRFWKRQLSKARRRQWKGFLRTGRARRISRYESECNWKTW